MAPKTAHMLLLCAVCVVGVGIARPAPAHADSLEDFEDSQRRRPSRPRRPAGPAPALTAPPPLVVAPVATYSAQNPADPLSTSLAFDMIVGDNPGTRFSFGLSPWRGRVRLQAPATNSDGFASPHGQGLIGYANPNVRSWRDTPDNRGALSPLDPKVQALYGDSATNALKPGMAEYLGLPDVQGGSDSGVVLDNDAVADSEAGQGAGSETEADGYLQRMDRPDSVANDEPLPERMRTFHLVLRGGASMNLERNAPARGFDSFLTLESSYTPAFTFWWQTLRDQPNADTLHLAQMAYEPRWVTSQRLLMRPILGASFIATEEGLLRTGALFGVGLEWFPVRPLYVEFRVAGQLYIQSFGNMDIFAALGVEILPTVFLYSSYRLVANEASALSIATAGLRFDIGF
jgi:hypothetical protein